MTPERRGIQRVQIAEPKGGGRTVRGGGRTVRLEAPECGDGNLTNTRLPWTMHVNVRFWPGCGAGIGPLAAAADPV
jgi:hypothetical protein